MPNRDSSASLNTWLGREGSRPASVQGEDLLGAEKVPQTALIGRLPMYSRQSASCKGVPAPRLHL